MKLFALMTGLMLLAAGATTGRSLPATRVRRAVEASDLQLTAETAAFLEHVAGGVGTDPFFRLCRPHTLGTTAGFDFAGNEVKNVECRGDCPAGPAAEDDDTDTGCDRSWGCAPADYTACSAGNCFEGGQTECIAQADETGDLVCAWIGGACGGCRDVVQADCDGATHPNCEWNPANGGSCTARGETTSPICDSAGNHCPGEAHGDGDCPSSAPTGGTSALECDAVGWKRVFRFGNRGPTSTEQPIHFTPAPIPDYGGVPTREPELDGPGRRQLPDIASGDNTGTGFVDTTFERIRALGPLLRVGSDADQTWIVSHSCDRSGCTVQLFSGSGSDTGARGTEVSVEYCNALRRYAENDGEWLVASGGRGAGCVPLWISRASVASLTVPTDCDCV